MESINGLPAHPLFVHAPVVLVPLAAIMAVVMLARPDYRRRRGWALVVAAVIGLVFTQLAVSSGYAFDELSGGVSNTDDHQALGETTRNFTVAFAVAAAATYLLDRRSGQSDSGSVGHLATAGMALTALCAILSTVWMVRTGEEGARLVWGEVIQMLPYRGPGLG